MFSDIFRVKQSELVENQAVMMSKMKIFKQDFIFKY
jgi:hypothetical protein